MPVVAPLSPRFPTCVGAGAGGDRAAPRDSHERSLRAVVPWVAGAGRACSSRAAAGRAAAGASLLLCPVPWGRPERQRGEDLGTVGRGVIGDRRVPSSTALGVPEGALVARVAQGQPKMLS